MKLLLEILRTPRIIMHLMSGKTEFLRREFLPQNIYMFNERKDGNSPKRVSPNLTYNLPGNMTGNNPNTSRECWRIHGVLT
jgi:hypothetical protein